jgi:hypothetical protein
MAEVFVFRAVRRSRRAWWKEGRQGLGPFDTRIAVGCSCEYGGGAFDGGAFRAGVAEVVAGCVVDGGRSAKKSASASGNGGGDGFGCGGLVLGKGLEAAGKDGIECGRALRGEFLGRGRRTFVWRTKRRRRMTRGQRWRPWL